MTDTFTDAMNSMVKSMQQLQDAMMLTGKGATELHQTMAYQNAVMRDCLLTDAEKEAQEDAIWECQALALRLEPKVYEATYTLFGTTLVDVRHGLFSRDVVVEAFTVASSFAVEPGSSSTGGLSYEPIPVEAFHVHVNGVNDLQVQFVGHTFRKPPYQFTTQASRSQSTPARVRIKVMA